MNSFNNEQYYSYGQNEQCFSANSYYSGYNYVPQNSSYEYPTTTIDNNKSYATSSFSSNDDTTNNNFYSSSSNYFTGSTQVYTSPSPTSHYTSYYTDNNYLPSSEQVSSLYSSTPYQLTKTQLEPIQLNENSFNSSSNASVDSNISPAIKKAEKRPRVIKLDLTKTSIGFGVAQKNNNRSETSDQCSSNPFKCTMCTQSFNIAAKLFMHQHKYHKNGSSLQCPICFKKFNSQANALVHLRAHTQEKTYKCHLCPLAFCDSSTLKKHVRTHTGEKPYECHLCTKKFTQSGNLKRHLAVHEKYDAIQAKNFPAVPTSYNSNTFY